MIDYITSIACRTPIDTHYILLFYFRVLYNIIVQTRTCQRTFLDSLLGDGFRLFTRVELRKKVYYRQFITMTTMYNFVLNQVGLFGVSFGFFLNPDLNFNYLITNTKKKKTKK
ncbi:hypothetical protein BLOT_008399 [Blomia tropicalis]|nr:hypothetical protein BLOT_008399 [Blomia tropicalis]